MKQGAFFPQALQAFTEWGWGERDWLLELEAPPSHPERLNSLPPALIRILYFATQFTGEGALSTVFNRFIAYYVLG